MNGYSMERKKNEIIFWCDDDKIIDDIARYISTYIDAMSWRRSIQNITRTTFLEEEE